MVVVEIVGQNQDFRTLEVTLAQCSFVRHLVLKQMKSCLDTSCPS